MGEFCSCSPPANQPLKHALCSLPGPRPSTPNPYTSLPDPAPVRVYIHIHVLRDLGKLPAPLTSNQSEQWPASSLAGVSGIGQWPAPGMKCPALAVISSSPSLDTIPSLHQGTGLPDSSVRIAEWGHNVAKSLQESITSSGSGASLAAFGDSATQSPAMLLVRAPASASRSASRLAQWWPRHIGENR